jgi:L-aminopeptidase/D-esterase-like protein
MKAAVADPVPSGRRGTGYGAFTTRVRRGWLAGSAAIGALYDASVTAATLFIVAAQVIALAAFIPLIARRVDQDGIRRPAEHPEQDDDQRR